MSYRRLPNIGEEYSQIPDACVFWLGGRDAGKVLCHVVADSAAERVVIFTSRVLQVVVTLVVEHLVRGQVHRSIEQLGKWIIKPYTGVHESGTDDKTG